MEGVEAYVCFMMGMQESVDDKSPVMVLAAHPAGYSQISKDPQHQTSCCIFGNNTLCCNVTFCTSAGRQQQEEHPEDTIQVCSRRHCLADSLVC